MTKFHKIGVVNNGNLCTLNTRHKAEAVVKFISMLKVFQYKKSDLLGRSHKIGKTVHFYIEVLNCTPTIVPIEWCPVYALVNKKGRGKKCGFRGLLSGCGVTNPGRSFIRVMRIIKSSM